MVAHKGWFQCILPHICPWTGKKQNWKDKHFACEECGLLFQNSRLEFGLRSETHVGLNLSYPSTGKCPWEDHGVSEHLIHLCNKAVMEPHLLRWLLRFNEKRQLGHLPWCLVKCYLVCAQSSLTFCNPMDCGLQGSSVHGIFQARILEWVAIPVSRRSSQPRDRTQVSCLAGRFFTTVSPGKPLMQC